MQKSFMSLKLTIFSRPCLSLLSSGTQSQKGATAISRRKNHKPRPLDVISFLAQKQITACKSFLVQPRLTPSLLISTVALPSSPTSGKQHKQLQVAHSHEDRSILSLWFRDDPPIWCPHPSPFGLLQGLNYFYFLCTFNFQIFLLGRLQMYLSLPDLKKKKKNFMDPLLFQQSL